MIRRREKPDGLPFRLYERRGTHRYSIGYKGADGKWAFKLRCHVNEPERILELRREAIKRAADIANPPPAVSSFKALRTAWLNWQESLPLNSPARRAESTLRENRRELETLGKAFDAMLARDVTKAYGYAYLDACLIAKDKEGNPRPRPEKGNKEIALGRVVFEWGVRRGFLKANPWDGIDKLPTITQARLVSDAELALAVEVGRAMGGPQLIAALACKTAFLCLRRSVEVRAMTRDQITADGIVWTGGKRKRTQAEMLALIEWSPELRATIDEALAIKRNKLAGSWYVFGNLQGQRYSKGGWKATLSKLMAACMTEATKRKLAFQPFSLQDCRPKGTTTKMARGDTDTTDATLHTSERMVRQVYDRRRVRVAKPAA